MIERSAIQFGNTTIPFDVQRSSRRKTVSLVVDAAGELTVTAPGEVPLARLNAVVRTKASWVLQRTKRASDRPPAMPSKEFVSGESVRYLGRSYRLRVIVGPEQRPPTLKRGWLNVHARLGGRSAVRLAVLSWLRERAGQYLLSRLPDLCDRHGIPTPAMILGDQKARWGSCDAGGLLRINWRIIQAPLPLVDYVLLHELTHLDHPAHGHAFWCALGRRMPDYEVRRARLRQLGPELVW